MGEANANQGVIWQMVHHHLLPEEDWQCKSSAMPTRYHAVMIWQDLPQRVWCIVDISFVLTPFQLVPWSNVNQYLLNQHAILELYNMIY